ncbi:MAG: four helix bundle protein [Candidatus Promineifilaceae bacterium]
MSELPHVGNFRELIAYRKAKLLAQDIFDLTMTFPKEEVYSLTSQIRRSSRSVGAQIAEAWGKRRYEAHFLSKLTDADGEQYETQHWLETAFDCHYLSSNQLLSLRERCEEVGRLLNGMMAKSTLFCASSTPKTIRETTAEYFITQSTDEL